MALTMGPNTGLVENGEPGEGHYAELMRKWRWEDFLAQPVVKSRVTTLPTSGQANGDTYLYVGSGGNANKLARWTTRTTTSQWEYLTAKLGWRVQVADELDTGDQVKTYEFDGSAWVEKAAAANSTGSVLNKTDPRTPVFAKTAAQSISIKAGTTVRTATALVTFDVATTVTMPTLSSGENYGVWVLPDGTAEALQAPAGAYDWGSHSNPYAVMIGGFHYGLVAPGTTPASGGFSTSGFTGDGGSMVWVQADVDKIAGINEYSLWDLQFRPKTFGLKGFAFDPEARVWGAIYFTGTNHIVDGLSKAGSDIASGTVLPRIPLAYGGTGANNYSRLSWYEANEIVQSHGCRLLDYQEFSSGAFGVTEAQSLGGASATPALTVRQPGYTSRLGWEQATGHVWSWGFNAHGAGGSAWVTGPNRGQSYGTPYATRFGGARTFAENSGSRCALWSLSAWDSFWNACLRAACDHLEPV